MIILLAIIGAIVLVAPILLPRVTELPYGMEVPVQLFMDNVNNIATIFPPLAVIWNVFLIAILFKSGILFLKMAWHIIKLARGGG